MIAVPEQITYTVKHQRRKTLGLYVLEDASIEVRAPKGVSKRVIRAFVMQRRDWALRQQLRIQNKLASQPRFCHGEQLPYLGGTLTLNTVESNRSVMQQQGNTLSLALKGSDQPARVEKAWQHWCRKQAQVLFQQRLNEWLARMPDNNFHPEMKLRRMKRRWGSCSSRQVITFNTRLIELPLHCIDYVVVHELCHLWHLNHGPEFYHLLQSVLPDWRQREQQIKHY